MVPVPRTRPCDPLDGPERGRLTLLIERDGLEAAKAWARRTAGIYRAAVLHNGRGGKPVHFASAPLYRRNYIESYRHLKRFAEATW